MRMDEVKRIGQEVAAIKVEMGVCARLKSKGILMRGSKPVTDLLTAYELKLVDLEEKLNVMKRPNAGAPPPAAAAAPRPSRR
jgi:hypothetical protein